VGTIPFDSLHYIVVYCVFPVETHLAISLNNITFTLLKMLFFRSPLFFSVEFCLAYSKDWARNFI